MNWNTASDILGKIAVTVGTAIVLGLFTLLSTKVRSSLFFKRVEYELTYTKGLGPVQWDIEWEGFRLTINAEDVSGDCMKKLKIHRNRRNTFELDCLEPSDRFRKLFDGEIEMKLNSIVRRRVSPP